jgi:hypothetical protein
MRWRPPLLLPTVMRMFTAPVALLAGNRLPGAVVCADLFTSARG